jgi:hypothetical protein
VHRGIFTLPIGCVAVVHHAASIFWAARATRTCARQPHAVLRLVVLSSLPSPPVTFGSPPAVVGGGSTSPAPAPSATAPRPAGRQRIRPRSDAHAQRHTAPLKRRRGVSPFVPPASSRHTRQPPHRETCRQDAGATKRRRAGSQRGGWTYR